MIVHMVKLDASEELFDHYAQVAVWAKDEFMYAAMKGSLIGSNPAAQEVEEVVVNGGDGKPVCMMLAWHPPAPDGESTRRRFSCYGPRGVVARPETPEEMQARYVKACEAEGVEPESADA